LLDDVTRLLSERPHPRILPPAVAGIQDHHELKEELCSVSRLRKAIENIRGKCCQDLDALGGREPSA
jgi:hypothetical protein